jgi:hypothetical protein
MVMVAVDDELGGALELRASIRPEVRGMTRFRQNLAARPPFFQPRPLDLPPTRTDSGPWRF